jgi:hypothetical protein
MPLSRLITLIIDIHRFKTCGHCGVQDAGQGRLRHPHSAKRGTINSTWKDFEASSRRHRVDGFAIYIDASYSSHALLIKEHDLKNVLVLPVWTPLTPCLPIVEITRVGELQTKPFIHDVNQQSMRRPKVKRSKLGLGLTLRQMPDGGDRRDRTDDLKLAKLPLSQLSYVPAPKQRHHAKSANNNSRRRMVGLGRLELPTSRLSSARSNQLSYRPEKVQALHKRPKERET